MIQLSKPKYPDKQTINLAIRNTNKIKNSLQIGSFVIFLICLTLFVKLAVIDRLLSAIEAERIYKATEQQIQILKEKTKEYDTVWNTYRMHVNAFYNEEEKLEVDRIDIINLVERCVLDQADIRYINIVGNTITISLENTSLPLISKIVSAFQEDEKTANVTVTTASNGNNVDQNKTATANLIVSLKSRGED